MRQIEPYIVVESDVDGEKILKHIEKAGRVCYKSEDKITIDSAKKFVRMIMKSGHESVIEHYNITVRVICDRGVTHEIVRHRIASYSQESTRYCNYSNDKFGNELTYITPCFWKNSDNDDYDDFKGCDECKYVDECEKDKCIRNIERRKNIDKTKIWLDTMEYIEKQYMELLNLGASPQEARSILPNSLKTEIVMTMNLREWRHFLKLRTGSKAHPQMREVAIKILNEFKVKLPVIFEDIEVE